MVDGGGQVSAPRFGERCGGKTLTCDCCEDARLTATTTFARHGRRTHAGRVGRQPEEPAPDVYGGAEQEDEATRGFIHVLVSYLLP